MTHSNVSLSYQKNHYLTINDISNSLYYYFDYDERAFDTNMPFQHLHAFYEIMIPITPNACHFIAGIPYALQPNDLVMLPPSLPHCTQYPKAVSSQRLIIGFLYPTSLWGMSDAFQLLLKPFYAKCPIYRFPFKERSLINEKLNRIYHYSFTDDPVPLKTLMVHQMFVDFLHALLHAVPHNCYTEEKTRNRSAYKIYTIANYIHNHFADCLTLDFLAKTFYISPCYLSHQFKEVTGHTITEYIQRTRIQNVQYQLLNSPKKISLLAEDCGFTSFSQFNRIFHKYCNQSPSSFKRNGGNEVPINYDRYYD